jgi:biopolymer transport protein ExbD
MGGIDTGPSPAARRRALDADINMIPMIDLLMVTISFLLITAVWTRLARIATDAQIPGPAVPAPAAVPEPRMHVHVRGDGQVRLAWRHGEAVIASLDLPPPASVAGPSALAAESAVRRYPDLAAAIATEWRHRGQHTAPGDSAFDEAVLHVDDALSYGDMVGVMDAIHAVHRDVRVGGRMVSVPALSVRFAAD